MTAVGRFLTFNCVGALGMLLQLSALAVFNRVFHGHYLVATVVSVELALLHNFAWHRRCTWRERPGPPEHVPQLLRFHLSNGLVSLLGNLILMRVLVRSAHWSLLLANITAIVCCSLLNFTFANAFVFKAGSPSAYHSSAAGQDKGLFRRGSAHRDDPQEVRRPRRRDSVFRFFASGPIRDERR